MSTNYQMLLTFNNEQARITFPQLPEQIDVAQGSSLQSVDVVGLGEIVIIGDRPAITISFSGVFPFDMCDPQENVDKIKTWIKAKKPVHLIVTGAEVNLFCAVEDFSYYEIGGDVGSVYYTFSLKEYREPNVSTVTVVQETAVVQTQEARVDNRVPATEYCVKSGDCLYNIARTETGDASNWQEIATLNGITSPYIIQPNQTLKMPG